MIRQAAVKNHFDLQDKYQETEALRGGTGTLVSLAQMLLSALQLLLYLAEERGGSGSFCSWDREMHCLVSAGPENSLFNSPAASRQ